MKSFASSDKCWFGMEPWFSSNSSSLLFSIWPFFRNTTYSLLVSVRNSYGMSDQSSIFTFKTKEYGNNIIHMCWYFHSYVIFHFLDFSEKSPLSFMGRFIIMVSAYHHILYFSEFYSGGYRMKVEAIIIGVILSIYFL